MIAHVGGAPVEETLLPWLSGAGTVLLVARAWVVAHGRPRRRGRRTDDAKETTP